MSRRQPLKSRPAMATQHDLFGAEATAGTDALPPSPAPSRPDSSLPSTPASSASKLPDNRLRESLALQFDRVPPGWRAVTDAFRAAPQGQALIQAVDARRAAGAVVYPDDVFRALRLTPLDAVRVVVLGQDPYHGPGQAEGLAFSVPAGVPLPPSLRNIFKERDRDLAGAPAASDDAASVPRGRTAARPEGSLRTWARQGVLLLNTSLTVEDGQAGSHAGLGWEALTDALIAAVAQRAEPAVFLLWGAHAQRKRELIQSASAGHWILEANHPSPLSATRGPVPFIGCGHFSVANAFGRAHGWTIDWTGLEEQAPQASDGPSR